MFPTVLYQILNRECIVDANIITGKHTILDYLMSPIAKTFKGALSEPLPSDHR